MDIIFNHYNLAQKEWELDTTTSMILYVKELCLYGDDSLKASKVLWI
jgi:hypothetical protein